MVNDMNQGRYVIDREAHCQFGNLYSHKNKINHAKKHEFHDSTDVCMFSLFLFCVFVPISESK